ncbi:MAG: DUF1353 domain-containing protein [Methylococcales bacterium]|nr:DUF1353 domain-containing protein [Methylococcales bacterium]
MEIYGDSHSKKKIKIEFDDIPAVRLQTIIPKENASNLETLALATKCRFFTLEKDWLIKLDNVSYAPTLNQTIKIPSVDDKGEKIIFDGASIPLPWLVSLLTIGVLRPLGVMLIASIVHDYAYKYGYLLTEDNTEITVDRHVADYLLRDIVGAVNGLSIVGHVAWFFVRIGWTFVDYNHKPKGGKKPCFEYALLIGLILLFIIVCNMLSFGVVVILSVISYLVFYLLTVYINKKSSSGDN